ncbi:MAG: polysaccharide biosynthesis tyrosine autokinase [Caldilineaceae bacterium]
MEILQYWKIIRKRFIMIILITMVFELGAVFYIQQQTPMYRTSTTLFISPSTLGSALPYQLVYVVAPLANTYSEFMRTQSFAKMVAEQMDVDISENEILSSLSMEYVRDTQIFKITATHPNPEVAQALANTTATVLIEANAARQQQQQQARLDASRSPEAQARQDQLTELTKVLQDELSYYNDQISLVDDEIDVLRKGPASAEVTQRVLDLREQLLQLRTERVNVLSSLTDTQNTLASMNEEKPSDVDTAVVIDPAPLPKRPVSRDLVQPLAAAGFFGLALGLGLAWLLEYIDYTVKSPEELDELYGVPTQGAIGNVGTVRAGQRASSLITITDPRSPTAEAFRSLRTSVRMAGAEKPVHSLLVTSAGPSEGKTFVATNLAISFAQSGKRVIMVDLDLRKPQVHAAFSVRREPGFSDLVVDRELTIDQCLHNTPVSLLKVLPCGTIPPHPSELLGSQRAADLIDEITGLCDIAIYDTAPAATVTDAVLVASQVDAVLQVVQARGTRIDLVRRCKTLLERSGARLLGPVLNRVESDDLGYYTNYYYYGGYYREDATQGKGVGKLFGRKQKRSSKAPAATYSDGLSTSYGNGRTPAQPKPAQASPAEPVVDDRQRTADGG